MATYANIEPAKSQFGDYRIGYAKSGATVKILGSHGLYSIYYANSQYNQQNGLSGYIGGATTLKQVSEALEKL